MEPVIQYTTTSDGVSIAFSTMSQGPPLLFMPVLPLSHLQVEWQMAGMRAFISAFAETHQIVRFDARGLGLSDRGASDRSLDGHIRDMEAVVTRLGLANLSIFAASYSGPMAIRFAARHPDLVERLILWCTHAYHPDVVAKLTTTANQQRVAVNDLAVADRDLFIRTYLHRAVGWSKGEVANQFVEVARQSIDPDHFLENLANHAAFDAREDLAHVQAPTLVMHRAAFVGSHIDVAKDLTSRIPNARLTLLEGDSVAPFIGDMEAAIRVVAGFLSETVDANVASPQPDSPVRTILFTDLEGHTAMMQRVGDDRGRDVLREHERITREQLATHGGEEIRSLGDGFLAAFHSTQQALRCAVDLQRAFAGAVPVHGEPLRVRVGVNAGEPISDGDELYGHAVEIAADIAAHARGGQILAAQVVRELSAGKGFRFGDGFEAGMPGEEAPARVFEVLWNEGNDQ